MILTKPKMMTGAPEQGSPKSSPRFFKLPWRKSVPTSLDDMIEPGFDQNKELLQFTI